MPGSSEWKWGLLLNCLVSLVLVDVISMSELMYKIFLQCFNAYFLFNGFNTSKIFRVDVFTGS